MTWTTFFELNLASHFQLALLLVGDPDRAELVLSKVIDAVDVSKCPDCDEMRTVKNCVVLNSLPISSQPSAADITYARRLLQSELWPILELPSASRFCFVVLILLRYPTSACAEFLGLEKSGVTMLRNSALLQLRTVSPCLGENALETSRNVTKHLIVRTDRRKTNG